MEPCSRPNVDRTVHVKAHSRGDSNYADGPVTRLAAGIMASTSKVRLAVGLFGTAKLGNDELHAEQLLQRRETVLFGGRSLGRARHWQPVLSTYRTAFKISRRFFRRSGGRWGSTSAHSSSVRSLG